MYEEDQEQDNDRLPMSFVIVKKVQNGVVSKPLTCLFDSGAKSAWINKKSVPPGIQGQTVPGITSKTLAGTFKSTEAVNLQNFTLPQFSKSRIYEKLTARVFHTPCRYDVIFGRDALRLFGMQVDFKDGLMICDEQVLDMRPFPNGPQEGMAAEMLMEWLEEDIYEDDNDDISMMSDDESQCSSTEMETEACDVVEIGPQSDKLDEDDEPFGSGYRGKKIKDSKYDGTTVEDVVSACKHLDKAQQEKLLAVLRKYEKLFDGKLKKFSGEKIKLELQQGAVPHRSRAYQVPHAHMEVFRKELERLVKIGVLERAGRAEWIAGTFIIPKKDSSVRWISDFRALNKYLRRKVYPLPRIADILARRSGYKFLTKLDISMQYYTFEVDDESKELCMIVTLFGLFRYRRLPMGVSVAPDIAQEAMERTLQAFRDIEVCMDDIACFSNEWEKHLELLDKLLSTLEKAGFTINPAKCEWAVQETDFLGHWLTPTGVAPYKKKVQAILRMQQPTNIKQLRSFLGLVNYYRDMWPRRSHVLAPLTALTGKKAFYWDEACSRSFKQMKAMVAMDVLLAYPDHNKPFHIETDASDYQLGAVIKQEGRPVAYCSRKLSKHQKNYSTIEKELLSVVETLKEFRTVLLGAEIHVHTDHKNLTHALTAFQTGKIVRWRLIVEEYGAKFHYKPGEKNVVADAISRVPTTNGAEFEPLPKAKVTTDVYTITLDDPEMAECLMEYPLLLTRVRA